MPVPLDAYGPPLYYDILHTPGTAGEVAVLMRIAKRVLARDPSTLRWLEPCCGSGRYLLALAKRGCDATGYDLDASMLRLAAQRAEEARLDSRVHVSRRDMCKPLPRAWRGAFDVAFCPHNSIRHCPSGAALVAHLRSVRDALTPGGVYIVGISLQPARTLVISEDVYKASRSGIKVHQLITFDPVPTRHPDGVERVTTITAVKIAKRDPITINGGYTLWCGSPERWLRLVKRAGLEQTELFDQAGKPAPTRRAVYALRVLRRPNTVPASTT